jgi:hypothetical protein
MRKSFVKEKNNFAPIEKFPNYSLTTPQNYSSTLLYGLVILFILVFTLGGLLIWNIVVTQHLNNSAEPSYNPVIFQVLTSNSLSLQGSTLNNPSGSSIYQYVGLQKGDLPLIDSVQTPHTALPLFSSLFTTATFGSTTFGNGDILTHGYYSTSAISDAVNPLAAVYFVYYQSCFQYDNATNICWTGTDFCSYPFIINFGSPNQVTFNNFAEVLAYAQTNVDSNVRVNPSNGCFYVTIDKDLVNTEVIDQITQNFTAINPTGSGDPFILSVGTQLGTKIFKLCTATYTENSSFDYYIATTDYYDFYVNYGDGTAVEHYVGIFGVGNPITHTYSGSAPTTVNVTIVGLMPGWCNLVMYEGSGGVNAMTLDVVSWGDVSLRQADFYYESHMLAISAGSPPPTLQGFQYFFPPSADPNVWANLNTWNVDNMTNAIGMFTTLSTGTIDLRGWTVPNLQYSSYMFAQVTAPVTGGFSDARPVSLIDANNMFREYASTEIDVSNYRTPNLRSALQMFRYTSNFPNLNVTNWVTTNLQNIESMFEGCAEIKPVFTNWNMQNITTCSYTIQSSNYLASRGISLSADYNQILIDFESKTNSTGLICNWGTAGGFRLPIFGVATGAGLTAKTNLINRGWNIVDLT